MSSFVEIIAKLKPKNNGNFKLLDAQDVECVDGKGLDEVIDEKLNINQGEENVGKAMVIDTNGNVVPGSALPDKVYTQGEVDNLLKGKMDIPYIQMSLHENTSIDCTLDMPLKINCVYGKIEQEINDNLQLDINKPAPMVSKKIKLGEGFDELKGLKESDNLFDLYLFSQSEGILGETYTDNKIVINIPIILQASKKYTFKHANSIAPALAEAYVRIQNSSGTNLGVLFYSNNKTTNEIAVNDRELTVTAPSNSIVYLAYELRTYDDEGNIIPTTVEIVHEKWFTKYVKEISIKLSGTSLDYINPTVRDCKIVNHAQKKSYIIRNVGLKKIEQATFASYSSSNNYIRIDDIDRKIVEQSKAPNIYCNVASPSIQENKRGITQQSGYAYLDWYLDIYSLGLNGYESVQFANNVLQNYLNTNDVYIQYELSTPTIEEIPYVETDISESGYTIQDATTPSLTIPSEMKGVNKIDIRTCGKNIFNIDALLSQKEVQLSGGKGKVLTLKLKPNTKYIATSNASGSNAYQACSLYLSVSNNYYLIPSYQEFVFLNHDIVIQTNSKGELHIVLITSRSNSNQFINKDVYMQLEEGDIATEYEPYQERSTLYELAKPLLKCGESIDTLDLKSLKRKNCVCEISSGLLEQAIISTINDTKVASFVLFSIYIPNFVSTQQRGGTILSNIGTQKEVNNTSGPEGIALENALVTRITVSLNKKRFENYDNLSKDEIIEKFRQFLKNSNAKFYLELKNPTFEDIDVELLEKLKQLVACSPITHIFLNDGANGVYTIEYPKDLALAQQKLEATVLNLQEEVVKNV